MVSTSFPDLAQENYYVRVIFPNQSPFLLNRISTWLSTSVAVVLIVLLFTYTLNKLIQQRKMSEIQTDFINNMTHELKTPLSTISISAEVLKKSSIDDERSNKYIDVIGTESARLQTQVDRVLQTAKIRESNSVFSLESVKINDLVQEVILGLKSLLDKTNAKIEVEIGPDLEIKADKFHFSNMISNIIENALKYCRTQPEISIRASVDNSSVALDIQDNEIGISKEEYDSIFERFYRVSTSNVHDVKGFGIGLYYAKLVVEGHNGKIDVESTKDVGSTFKLRFPS